jgi:hypothetical protein
MNEATILRHRKWCGDLTVFALVTGQNFFL